MPLPPWTKMRPAAAAMPCRARGDGAVPPTNGVRSLPERSAGERRKRSPSTPGGGLRGVVVGPGRLRLKVRRRWGSYSQERWWSDGQVVSEIDKGTLCWKRQMQKAQGEVISQFMEIRSSFFYLREYFIQAQELGCF